MSKQVISEEMKVHEEWYNTAKQIQTPEQLSDLINHLINDYEHDYGTICHACAAAAIAAANVINRSPVGGITGFQASAIFWEFWRHWFYGHDLKKSPPATLLEHTNLLYPQYEYKYTSIFPETWKWVQEEAKKLLLDDRMMDDSVKSHLQSIVDGVVPFGLTVRED